MFLNAAARFTPRGGETPASLLSALQAIERELGRTPKRVLNEARSLDLDLIAWGAERVSTPGLVLPHPRAHLRRFVLAPLEEIAPDVVLPGQTATIRELLAELRSDEEARRIGDARGDD
jgi:2-amino-4-hydroxy-6-hydroxymethyldihydropteridine diphosphokinase